MQSPGSKSNAPITILLIALIAICGLKLKHDWDSRARSIAASRLIEQDYPALFSRLDLKKPTDLTPRFLFIREQILKKHSAASETEKKAVYSCAVDLLDAMIDVAAERRRMLESVLTKASEPRVRLDMAHSVTSSASHFIQLDMERAYESLNKRKPALDQLLLKLQRTEGEWNARLPKAASNESYDPTIVRPTLVTVRGQERNPLDRR